MTTPDDRGLVALKLMHLAMEWIKARIDLLADCPSILIHPLYRNVTIGFGYHSEGSESLAKVLRLLEGQTATRKRSTNVWDYSVGDKTNGICFTWYVWREAYDLSEETEVTL